MKVKRHGRILDLDLTEFTDVMMQKKASAEGNVYKAFNINFFIYRVYRNISVLQHFGENPAACNELMRKCSVINVFIAAGGTVGFEQCQIYRLVCYILQGF